MRVDPATNSVVVTTRMAYPPCGILAADKTGVWSTGASCGDVVARVDSRTNRLTTYPAEKLPVGIEVAFGSVWVANEGSGNIDQIDPHSGRLVARLHVPRPRRPARRRLWLGLGQRRLRPRASDRAAALTVVRRSDGETAAGVTWASVLSPDQRRSVLDAPR